MRQISRPDRFDILLRLGGFVAVALPLWLLLANLLPGLDPVSRSVSASLVAGLTANLISARWFGTLHFSDFGLGWDTSSANQLALGLLLGVGSMSLLVLGSIAAGLAHWEPADAGNLAWLTGALLAGAAGEELLFRGYAFQYLAQSWPTRTIIGSGILFGLTHVLLNQNIQLIGTLNTALWGALLGYAYWRTKTLWLPIGIHYGWNLAQVLFGASLSGTTIGATGVRLVWSAGEIWSGGDYGPEGGLLTTAAGLAVLLMLRRVR